MHAQRTHKRQKFKNGASNQCGRFQTKYNIANFRTVHACTPDGEKRARSPSKSKMVHPIDMGGLRPKTIELILGLRKSCF